MKLIMLSFYSNSKISKISKIQNFIAIWILGLYPRELIFLILKWHDKIISTRMFYTKVHNFRENFKTNFLSIFCIWHEYFFTFFIQKFIVFSNYHKRFEIFINSRRHVITSLKSKYQKFHSCIVAKWEHTKRVWNAVIRLKHSMVKLFAEVCELNPSFFSHLI